MRPDLLMRLIVGTRGSKLSLIQTESVTQRLERICRDITVETKIIKTAGDSNSSLPLLSIKQKGIFEREIDKMVLRGDVDFAVHSLKDIPTDQPRGTAVVAVPKRDSPYDVLVSNHNLPLERMPFGASVGTSSPRRMVQLYRARPDLRVKPIRGNVETRIRKLDENLYDAIVLAEAGILRLGMKDRITQRLPLMEFMPSAGQGALALVTRKDNKKLISILGRVNHPASMAEAQSERTFMDKIGGGCKVPLGVIARVAGRTMNLHGCMFSPDGRVKMEIHRSGDAARPKELGASAAADMMKLGATSLISSWRNL